MWASLQFWRVSPRSSQGEYGGSRHGAGTGAESFYLIQSAGRKIVRMGLAWTVETLKPTPTDTALPARSHLLTFPKRSTIWEPNVRIYESMGVTLVQAITYPKWPPVPFLLLLCDHCSDLTLERIAFPGRVI